MGEGGGGDLQQLDERLRALLRERAARFPGAPPLAPDEPAPPRPLARSPQPRTVVLVGGRGMMGRFLASRLEAAGHEAIALDKADWIDAPEVLPRADLALICVPIEHTQEAIHRTAQHLMPHAALADITSIKRPFLQAMLEAHDGPVMGLHPMFGPGVDSFLSQRVVACPGRGDEAFAWLLDLVREDGGTVVVASAEEHDHAMTTIQAIRHFATFSLGTFLAAEHPDIARTLEFSSPIYRLELDMVCRLFAQDAGLYVDIMTATQERRDAIARLAENAARLARLAEIGDRAGLVRCFEETARSLGPAETARALEESARVIRALAGILASGRVNKPAPAP